MITTDHNVIACNWLVLTTSDHHWPPLTPADHCVSAYSWSTRPCSSSVLTASEMASRPVTLMTTWMSSTTLLQTSSVAPPATLPRLWSTTCSMDISHTQPTTKPRVTSANAVCLKGHVTTAISSLYSVSCMALSLRKQWVMPLGKCHILTVIKNTHPMLTSFAGKLYWHIVCFTVTNNMSSNSSLAE